MSYVPCNPGHIPAYLSNHQFSVCDTVNQTFKREVCV